MIRNVDITRNRSYGRILNNVKYLYIINCIDINTGTGVSRDLAYGVSIDFDDFPLLLARDILFSTINDLSTFLKGILESFWFY